MMYNTFLVSVCVDYADHVFNIIGVGEEVFEIIVINECIYIFSNF